MRRACLSRVTSIRKRSPDFRTIRPRPSCTITASASSGSEWRRVSDTDVASVTAAQLLDLEPLGAGRFRSRNNQRNHSTRIFGGQLLAQALMAAMHTVQDWPAQSLHGYFLRGGAVDLPVDYAVDELRNG